MNVSNAMSIRTGWPLTASENGLEQELSSSVSTNIENWGDFVSQAEQPSIVIFSDTSWNIGGSVPDANSTVADLARGLGFRILDQVSLAGAVDRLAQIVDVDAILLRCSGGEAGLDLLLARLDMMASNHGVELIIAVDLMGIDQVHALAGSGSANILCQPDYADIVSALAVVSGRSQQRQKLYDIGRDENDHRLDRLSDELGRLSRTIEALVHNRAPVEFLSPAGHDDGAPDVVRSPVRSFSAMPAADNDEITARQVRAVLRARRLRDDIFKGDLFADPAWDILLDLMAARLENSQVSVSSLCIAAAVPPTTALRWIRQLTEQGLLEREADPEDGRRIFIILSDMGMQAVLRWFRESQIHLVHASGQRKK